MSLLFLVLVHLLPGDHIKIIPLPSDPFRTLHGAFNVRKPFKELRKQAKLMAEGEVSKEKN